MIQSPEKENRPKTNNTEALLELDTMRKKDLLRPGAMYIGEKPPLPEIRFGTGSAPPAFRKEGNGVMRVTELAPGLICAGLVAAYLLRCHA